MKGQIWKKAAALALSAVLLTAGVPFEPVADLIGQIPITASADGVLSGSGTQESPYLITSSDDWNTFAENVNAGTNADAYYRLDDSIEVTTTVGTSAKPFTGTFDGDGNTLTVNIEETSTAGTAPFREISGGAVIKNLTVTGSVAGTTHAAGLVGMVRNGSSESPNTIDNCVVSTAVTVPGTSGNRHMGGVVGHATTSYLKIKDTMFNGTMSNTGNYAGGLQGWCDGNHLTIENSIFTGSYTGGGSFHPIAVRDSNKSMDYSDLGAYYTTNPTLSDNAYIAAAGTGLYSFTPFGFIAETFTAVDGNTYYKITDGQGDAVIDSADEWDLFAKSVDSGITYEGKTITLGADISVTTMAAKSNRFKGTFLGKAHLITINYTADGENAAPFGNVENASIACLRTAGTLTTDYKFAAGIAAQTFGTTYINNCISSVDIVSGVEGDGTHGGLVGVAQSSMLTINNCLFNGTVTGENTTCCGGLVGWKSDKLNISNSLMAGTFAINANSDSSTFSRNSVTPTNSYYVNALGTVQGTAVGSKTNEELAQALGTSWTVNDGKVVPLMTDNDLLLAKVSGVEETYSYTGSDIEVNPVVTALDNVVLTKGTHYTAELARNGEPAASVKERGAYKYTFTAIDGSGYTGSVSVDFNVVIMAPTYVRQTDYSDSTASITWDQVSEPTSWTVEYCKNKDFSSGVESVQVTEKSASFADLDNETTYYARVRAEIDGEKSEWSKANKFETTSKLWLGVGSSTSSANFPTFNYWRYTYSQQFYLASELGDAGAITSVSFYQCGQYSFTRDIEIYMAHTDLIANPNTNGRVMVSDEDLVFSGSVLFGADQWVEIPFDNSFIYNGEQNVLLIVNDITGAWEESYKSSSFLSYYNPKQGGYNNPVGYRNDDSTRLYPTQEGTINLSSSSYKSCVRFEVKTPYSIILSDSQNGSLSASRDKATSGDIVKITPEPDEGFLCENILVNGGEVEVTRNVEDNTFTFIMPDGDAEVVGIFAQPHDVSVTWKNYDGTVLKTETLLQQTVPSYDGDVPTKPDDLFYSYTFDGWDKKLEKIYADTTFTAVYRSTPLATLDYIVCDDNYVYDSVPYYSAYNNDVTGSETIYPSSMLSGLSGNEIWSLTYFAYDDYEVNVHGMKVYLAEVDFTSLYNNWVKPPENAVLVFEGDYVFGSDENTIEFSRPFEYNGGNLLVIIENTSAGTNNPEKKFFAKFISNSYASRYKYSVNNNSGYTSYLPKCKFGYLNSNLYTVTWKGEDGTVLETDDNLIEGTMPEFNGTIPDDYEDDFFTYSYKWDKRIVPVTCDETYTLKVVKHPKATNGVTVADGTNMSESIPYKSQLNHTTTGSQQIYSADMLTSLNGKDICSLTFYSSDDVVTDVKGMQVYLAEVDYTSFSGWTAIPDNAVKVFDDDYDFISGENVIVFDEMYTYHGGNLMIVIQNTSNGTNHSDKHFYGIYGSSGCSAYRYTEYNYNYTSAFLAKCTFGYPDTNTYTVTWKDTDGTVLQTDTNVLAGTIPEFNGQFLENYSDETFSYVFSWDKEITAVTADVTYTIVVKKTPLVSLVEYTVCDKTDTSSNIPYYGAYNYSYAGSEQIYPSSQLTNMNGKDLFSIAFYSFDSVEIDVKGMQVYLAEVDYTVMPSCRELPDNAVKVFDGDYTLGSGKNVIEFDDAYTYGGGNLMVILRNTAPGNNYQSKAFYGSSNNQNGVSCCLYGYNNDSDLSSFLPKCTFGYEDTNTYTVTWKNADGEILEVDEDVLPGSQAEYNGEIPEAPEKYHFVGWMPTETTVYADVTYTTIFERDPYTVTFDEANGNITTQSIGSGERAKRYIPQKDGYAFIGWFVDDEPYNFSTDVNSDLTLTAHWRDVSEAKELEAGAVLYSGDLVHFGNNYYNSDDENGAVSAKQFDEYGVIGEFYYYEDYNQYSVRSLDFIFIAYVTSEEYDEDSVLGLEVTGGDGSSDNVYTFAVVQETHDTVHTVIWYDTDGETILEVDEGVPWGTQASFDTEIIVPEGECLLWNDGTKKYSENNLPKIKKNTEFTAEFSNIIPIELGAVFGEGDTVDFGEYYFVYDDYEDNDPLIADNVGILYISTLEFHSDGYYVNGSYDTGYDLFLKALSDIGEAVIKVTGGDGTEDNPFTFRVLRTGITVNWYDTDGETLLETDENVIQSTVASFDGEIEVPEGRQLCWYDGYNYYVSDNLPEVEEDIDFTAVFLEPVQPIAVGVVFTTDDVFDFGDFYCVCDDEDGDADIDRYVSGIQTIGSIEWHPEWYQYKVYNSNDDTICYVTCSEELEGEVAIKIVAGSGTESDPFVYKPIVIGAENEHGYKVVFKSNGETVYDVYVASGETLDFDKEPSSEDGYVFSGWLDENGELFDFNTPITEDRTLTALWTDEYTKVTLTLMSEDGETKLYSETFDAGYIMGSYYNSMSFTTRDPEWVFEGWYTADGTKFDFSLPLTEDVTLYEKWVPIDEYDGILVTLQYFDNVVARIPLEYGDKVPSMIGMMMVPGFDFNGWYNGDTLFDFDTPVTESITLTANLTKTEGFEGNYVTFKDGDKIYDIIGVPYGEDIPYCPQIISDRDGYAFDNWYYGDLTWDEVAVTQDIDITAKWVLADNIAARLAGHNLILGDDIGVNFYMELGNDIVNSETAKMIFTIPDGDTTKTEEILVSKIVNNPDLVVEFNGKTYYIFPCHVAAKEMTSTITAQIVDEENGVEGIVFKYDIKQYAEYVISHPDEYDEGAVDLVKAMLNYGTAAQMFFGKNVNKPANAGLDDADKEVTPFSEDELAAFEAMDVQKTEEIEGVPFTYEGSQFVLNSKTTYRLRFSAELDGWTVSYNGTPLDVMEVGEYRIITIADISPDELFNDITITFTPAEGDSVDITFSPTSYITLALEQDDESLANVVTALYRYYEAAYEYVNAWI